MPDKVRNEFPRLKSVDRIAKIPVVETGCQYASVFYSKIKNSNCLVRWSLDSVEGTLHMVLDKTIVAIPLIEMPLNIVDGIVCKGIDTVEQRVPAITYPPELLVNLTKDYVSSKVIQPVVKRADSVKQLSISEASKYGELAVSRLDNALDVADKYVDRYLPDSTDSAENKDSTVATDNKTKQTIEHANRFSRKLKRRLTRRTVAEAKALRKQGVDTMQCLLYFADLLIRDPKQFMEKVRAVWAHLSEDEPENQVPPANIEQLIAMISREMARRFVHLTNFTASTASLMPRYTLHAFHFTSHHVNYLVDYLLKEALLSHLSCASKPESAPMIPLTPISAQPQNPAGSGKREAGPQGGAAVAQSPAPNSQTPATPAPKEKPASELPTSLEPKPTSEGTPNGDTTMKKIN